jgi:hypothetical protein
LHSFSVIFPQNVLKLIENSTVFIYQQSVNSTSDGVKFIFNMGTGFIVSSDGYIITNAHVVANNNPVGKLKIIYQNKLEYEVDIIRLDFDYDLALLKISNKISFENFLSLSDENEITDGMEANFIGYPLLEDFQKQNISLKASISRGLINKKEQPTNISKKTMDIYEISTEANPGNSGGPLYNPKSGKVIGIVTKRLSLKSTGISFAVSVKYAKLLLLYEGIVKPNKLITEDLKNLLDSIIFELDGNLSILDKNIFIFEKNIELKDSNKVLISSPNYLETKAWDNAKINKINILNELDPQILNELRTCYNDLFDYNEKLNTRTRESEGINRAMTNFNERRIQTEKLLLDVSKSINNSITILNNKLVSLRKSNAN